MNPTMVDAPAVPTVARRRMADFVGLAKPRITLMVVLTAAAGFCLGAADAVDFARLVHLLVGTALCSAGASALNMVWERKADAAMERTRRRPIPAGRLSATEGTVFGLALSLAGTAELALMVNTLTAGIAAFTVLSYVLLYTPSKMRTSFSTVIGAVPGALPPVMGWTAATGRLGEGAVALFLILFFWQLPHFLALAWRYREDYARAGYPMLPVIDEDGSRTARQAVLQTCAMIVASLLPLRFGLAGGTYLAVAVLGGAAFLATAVFFALRRDRASALRLFMASVIYLPVVMGILAVDHLGII